MKAQLPGLLAVSVAALLVAPAAMAQHSGDIGIALVNNQLTTGRYVSGVFQPGLRVFGVTLGELFPNFASSPGFDSLPAGFPVPSTIGFKIVGGLRLWQGGSISGGIADVRIGIGFGPLTPVMTPLTDVTVGGFNLAVGSNGQWHRHLEYTLQEPASEGVYVMQMSLVGSRATMQESLPFWLVFNQNREQAEQDAAIAWLEASLVAGCSLADVASDSSDQPFNPNNSVGPEDIEAFVDGFITENAAVADVASDSSDVTRTPNGSVGPEDLEAFVNAFIAGC